MASKLFAVVLLLGLCAAAFAQQPSELASLPEGPAPNFAPAPAPNFAPSTLANSPLIVAPVIAPKAQREIPRKVADKKFIALGALTLALMSTDMEMTRRCLAANVCREMNPLLPTHNHAAMYAANLPIDAAVLTLAYWRKKHGHRDWFIAPAIDAGIHAYGMGTNIKFVGQYK